MGTKKNILFILLLFSLYAKGQYSVAWARTLGGNYIDQTRCAIETLDHGIMVAGFTFQNRKTLWLVKLSSTGAEVFGKTYDSLQRAEPAGIIQVPDSGYIIVGNCTYKKKAVRIYG